MPEQAFIYALLDSESGRPRYVGHSKDVQNRVRIHWNQRGSKYCAHHNPGMAAWLCSLTMEPEYRVIGIVPWSDRVKWERYYTDRLRQVPGIELLNIASGNVLPPEWPHRAKGSDNPRYGEPRPAWIHEKLRLSHAGIPQSEETKAKISQATRGENNPNYGKTHSPETRAKISAGVRAARTKGVM